MPRGARMALSHVGKREGSGGGGGGGRGLRRARHLVWCIGERAACKRSPKHNPAGAGSGPMEAGPATAAVGSRHSRGFLWELDIFFEGPLQGTDQQPPTATNRQPPAATNRPPPTTANRHQPPITNHQPPPTTTNRQSPTANRQAPPTMAEHMSHTRSFCKTAVQEHFCSFSS